MRFFQTILFITLAISMVSCTTSKKESIVVKPKAKKAPKVKVLNLEESLVKIGANIGDPIFIRIFKKERELELWVKLDGRYKLCKIYKICTYSGKLGPKLKQGDLQSPEGFYTVAKRQLKPNSKYFLAFNLGFPNRYDRNLGRTGSYLMVHGKCTSTGCYAMNNQQMKEIYTMAEASLNSGQKRFSVHIFPFRMSKKNMEFYRDHKWYDFWVNLKLGYDIFERYNVVPIVKAPKKRYRFYMKKI